MAGIGQAKLLRKFIVQQAEKAASLEDHRSLAVWLEINPIADNGI
jgi:hypothetical protein